MPASRLTTIRVEKPWGRRNLWPGFDSVADSDAPVGEIWFQAPAGCDPELLVKYLFTAERLSIQVHPDDAAAQAAGFPRGKDEAWVVLAAEPDAVIGVGLTKTVTPQELRAAALDGQIEPLLHWHPVKAGDVIYSPAGTIHAIGAGLTLIEVQQSLDLTYRLYDYGRPRALHLEEAMAVSMPIPFTPVTREREIRPARVALTEGVKFVLEQWDWTGTRELELPEDVRGWIIPVTGTGLIDGVPMAAGECWLAHGRINIALMPQSTCLCAYIADQALPILSD